MKMLTRGKSETPPCSPWLCERKNADGEKAPTERRPPLVARVRFDIFQADLDFCKHRDTLTQIEPHQDDKNTMPTPHHPSAAALIALKKLGCDLHDARRRRRLPMAVLAERAFTSRSTLQRIEAGDPAVSAGIYAAVLHALGLLDGLGDLADPARDSVGLALASESLPKRIRLKTAKKKP